VAIAIGAVGVGFVQATEARRLRIDQAQPQVVATMEVDGASVDLVVKNYGPTSAHDVRLDIQPRPRRSGGETGTVEAVWIPEVIPTLAPGQEWRTWWDSAIGRSHSDALSGENYHAVTATYEGARKGKRESTKSTLNWGSYEGIIYTEIRTLHDAARALEGIRDSLKGWTDPNGGLRVMSRDGSAADEERRIRLEQRRAARTSTATEVPTE